MLGVNTHPSARKQINDRSTDLADLEISVRMAEHCWMIYVLAYPLFDRRVSEALAAFRGLHEPARAQLVAPHVTLVFGVRNSSSEEISNICRRVAATTSVFSTKFSTSELSYDPFEKTHKISLLCAEGANLITSLHEKLYEGPHHDELHPDIPYRPHMTVGANADRSQLKNANTASIGHFPIKAEINSLSVLQLADGKLNAISSIGLKM